MIQRLLPSVALCLVLCVSTADAEVAVKTLEPGDGTTFGALGKNVVVHYTGKLEDGTVFDTSEGEGEDNEPVEFTVGKGEVVACFDKVLPKMSVGEKAQLTCPPELGYGEEGAIAQGVPPNAQLTFELSLLKVEEAKESSAPESSGFGGGGSEPEDQFRSWDRDRSGFIEPQELTNSFYQSIVVGRSSMPSQEETMAEMDTDRNGKADEEEYVQFLWKEVGMKTAKEDFGRADVDGDGNLSGAEYRKCSHAFQSMDQSIMMKARMDVSKIDPASFDAGFGSIDKDGNGAISKKEYYDVVGVDWFSGADTNKDSKVSKTEWLKFPEVNYVKSANEDTFIPSTFEVLDANKDDHVTALEYHHGMKRMAEDILAKGYGGGKDEM